MERYRVLIADDEQSIRFLLTEVMTREGYDAFEADNGLRALEMIPEVDPDLLIIDVKMPGMDGLTLLKEIRKSRPDLVVVVMTAFGGKEIAVEAMRQGAYDFFTKPFELDELRIVVRRALEKQSLRRRIMNLEERLHERLRFDRIIGRSPAMQRVFALLERVVASDVTVLITGESGTGKELVAQAVHYHSLRKTKPFVSVNCAAIPENLLESELFGHERGAFTGAVATKQGQFERANTGTLFLDEIGELPLALQSKLLRALQEREIVRVGGTRPIKVDLRVIAATNQNLHKSVYEAKTFREDLYFRLNVVPVELPPLRDRPTDIPLLVEHLVQVHNQRLNRNIMGVEPAAMRALVEWRWPGNVRELENVLQRAIVLALSPYLRLEDLPRDLVSNLGSQITPAQSLKYDSANPGSAALLADPSLLTDFGIPLQQKIERFTDELEKSIILAALEQGQHRRQATADLLGISRKSLHNKMVKYNLFEADRPDTQDDGE